MKKLLLLLLLLLLSGCTTAGPFVTNISSNGKGGLVVEKSMVEMNLLMGVISNKDTSSTTIQVTPETK